MARCVDRGVSPAVLFSIGKFALGLDLGSSSVSSSFGAAGSLIVLAALGILLGANFFLGRSSPRCTQLRGHAGPTPPRTPSAVESVKHTVPEQKDFPLARNIFAGI